MRKILLISSIFLMGCGPYYYELKTYHGIDQKPFDSESDSTRIYYHIDATSYNSIIPFFYNKHIVREPYLLKIRILSAKASIEGAEVHFRSVRIIFPDSGAYDLLGPEDKKYPLMMVPMGRGFFECELDLKISPFLLKYVKDSGFIVSLEVKLPGSSAYKEMEQKFESREKKWKSTIITVMMGI